ncbi:rhomboid family intramembrane serine protease GlpG [Ferrimonas aestuarii]|uniref:Rhomboid family intramembrane serine protease GlpG n=2 Tax=Ferrimonas aestuarii TaxID=2569539 RepID=A0A4U1BPI2_9GAMM|nr:rhomboid family intramembrane serine protease GlpG [Ferrimonas aestuarii]
MDYLRGMGIQAQVQQGESLLEIWVLEQDQAVAEREWQRFVAEPNHPRYHEASWHSGDTHSGLSYGKGASMMASIRSKAGPLTLTIMVLCLAIYLPWFLGWQRPIFNVLHFFESWQAFSLAEGWRIFTPTLIHFDPMHIVFNLLWWWQLGGLIERRLGTGKLFVVLIVGGTLPNLVQFAMVGPNFGGLSGVVYALVGYCWMMGRLRPESGIGLPQSYMMFLVLWMVAGFAGFMNMANWAHLGGLVVGLAQAGLDSRQRH